MTEPTVTVTRYEVSTLPDHHPDRWLWAIHITRTTGGWTIHDANGTYDEHGKRAAGSHTPVHGDLDTALTIARQLAPGVTFAGQTAPTA